MDDWQTPRLQLAEPLQPAERDYAVVTRALTHVQLASGDCPQIVERLNSRLAGLVQRNWFVKPTVAQHVCAFVYIPVCACMC